MKKLRIGQLDTRDISTSAFASAAGLAAANAAINTVSSNASTATGGANLVEANLSAYASYANSTFATDTNLNTVQDNVATNATTITVNKSVSDQFGTYANSTFATSSYVDSEIASLVDSAPATLDTLNELAAALGNDANLSVTLTNQINSISSNTEAVNTELDAFGSYANSTFASGNVNAVQSNVTVIGNELGAFGTYANANFLTTAAANVASDNYAVDASTNTFTLVQSVSNVNNIFVILDGLIQSPDTYTVSDTTLTISNVAPLPAGINVDVRYLQFVFPGTIDGGGV